MTEQQWLTSNDPTPMLMFLRGRARDERSLWLFTLACFRRVWGLVDVHVRQGVESSERHVEGMTASEGDAGPDAMGSALHAVRYCQRLVGRRRGPREAQQQAHLLREVVRNPFRPVALDPSWLTSDVLALAKGIYDEGAFDRMPILHDALMDAGCSNQEVLGHCRQEGHVRGCWVVDLLLGKA
jgi:hypothetical protein